MSSTMIAEGAVGRSGVDSFSVLRSSFPAEARPDAAENGERRPGNAAEIPVAAFHAISIPRRTYTGDFWFARLLGDTLWFALGDVAGKGAASAVWMAMIQEELDALLDPSMKAKEPCSVVRHLDEVLREELPPNRFATLVIGRLEADGSLTLANAGHCPPVILRRNGTIERLPTNGPPVGILPNRCWGVTRATLDRGDLLVAYSDGVIEARTSDGAELGVEGTEALIASVEGRSPRVAASRIAETLTEKALVEDDVTIFVLSRDPNLR